MNTVGSARKTPRKQGFSCRQKSIIEFKRRELCSVKKKKFSYICWKLLLLCSSIEVSCGDMRCGVMWRSGYLGDRSVIEGFKSEKQTRS